MSIARLMQMTAGAAVDTSWTLDNVTPAFDSNGGRFSIAVQEASPSDIFFKPDGLKMYIIGFTGDAVYEYDLSTAWDITSATYLQNFSVATEETVPRGLFFKPDGTKMYVVGIVGDDVNEYDLSTAWDVTSASYLQNFSVSAQQAAPTGLFFKPDGTKVYVVGIDFSSGNSAVSEYDLSTAWDVSSASHLQNFIVASQDTSPAGVFFKPDGTKMYVAGAAGRDINEYDLSTAWDISSASYLQNFSVAAQDTSLEGVFFKPDGTKVYIIGAFNDTVYEYILSTAWNINTAAWIEPTTGYFSVVSQETEPHGLFFKPDGTKMYVVGQSGDDVNEYDLSTAWDVTTASYLQNFSVSAQETLPVGIFFKPDGTKMYVAGAAGDDVNEYDLSTAWDISTASYLQNFSIATEDTSPQGLFFKPDGTKMYVIGSTGDDVNEYDLSTAWDISSAAYVQNFSVATEETVPSGLFFKPDGTKMYVVGIVGDDVNEYDLSTAWDISSASYVQNFSVAAQDLNPQDIFLKPDGTKMYVLGFTTDAIWEYNLT